MRTHDRSDVEPIRQVELGLNVLLTVEMTRNNQHGFAEIATPKRHFAIDPVGNQKPKKSRSQRISVRLAVFGCQNRLTVSEYTYG